MRRIANNPDAIAGNLQGGVAAQGNTTPDGAHCYVSNGGNWGNAIGGMITSETVLGTVQTCEYTLSAMLTANGVTEGVPGAVPFVLELEVGGEIITPTSEVSPDLISDTWQEYSRTYSSADLAGYVGQPIKVVIGVDRNSSGTQTKFDDVTLTADIAEDPNVIAGDDLIAFTNVPIDLAGNVITKLTGAQSYLWTAYPGDGVVFSAPVDESDPNTSASLNTTVTIPESGLTTLALTVTFEDNSVVSDVMVVSVYTDKCAAAKIVDPDLEFDITDFNGDCNTNLEDLLIIAAEWLIDYNAAGPVEITASE